MFPNFEEKKTLINSYFYPSFNYCPLVWMFSRTKSLNKVGSLQKRPLRFLYDDYVSHRERLIFHSIQYRNGWLAASDLFGMFFFLNCYLATPRPTLGHYQGDSLTHPMLITAFCIFDLGVTGAS